MNRDRVRDQIIDAAESHAALSRLYDLVESRLEAGDTHATLLEDCEQVRRLVDEDSEQVILDVMDTLVGWCAPSVSLARHPASEL